ncbi:manganese efflux pump MntP family protein [Desulfofalx alkaliphila]|uniref:manganese efflux pump MntP n=1 Tax=Desulfofalx alkaliphila TaxID=105483 RepID=UPI0004E1086E|nr:manganese efflux pump MntP family protein [Desulfofalx alkaliphila]
MTILMLLLLAVALGADAISLCVGIGMAGIRRKQIYLLTFTIGIFHVIMPVAGYYIGEVVGGYLDRAAAIIGALILIYLGVRMIKEVFSEEGETQILLTNTWGLIVLAGSVSMDALSVGFTLGVKDVNLMQAAIIFGLVAGLMTYLGLTFGKFIGSKIGNKAQLFGGLILIGIGISFLF